MNKTFKPEYPDTASAIAVERAQFLVDVAEAVAEGHSIKWLNEKKEWIEICGYKGSTTVFEFCSFDLNIGRIKVEKPVTCFKVVNPPINTPT
jgi:hypothetical protein